MKITNHRMGRRGFLSFSCKAVGGAAAIGVAGACGQGSPGGNGGYGGEVAVTHLDAIVGAAPFHIASALGYYEEAELQLELVSFSGGTETIRGMTAGMDFGMAATLSGLVAVGKGQDDLRLIGGAFNKPAVVFLVPADSELRSVSDLENKKIGVSRPGSITNYFGARIAREQGLEPDQDVQIVNVGGPPDAWTAAKQGVVDVAWSNPPFSDELIDRGDARLLFRTSDFVDRWPDVTYWTTQPFIDDSPEILERWLEAQQRAMDTIKNDVDQAAEAYGKAVDLDPAVARTSLKEASEAFDLAIDMPGVEENLKAGGEMGQLDPDAFDLQSVVVDDFARIKR